MIGTLYFQCIVLIYGGGGMLDIKKLYDLQEIDLQISVLEKELVTLANNLKDKSKIELVENKLKNLEIRISNIASQQRASERALSDIEDKLENINSRLYGGTVSNPQQLAATEEERQFTSNLKEETEDKLLLIMDQLDKIEPDLIKIRALKTQLETERPILENDWRESEVKIKTDLEDLRTKRSEIVPNLPGNILLLYESLSKKTEGKVLAMVERGICQGCRLSLTTQELQKLRSNSEMVRCNSCDRILYLMG